MAEVKWIKITTDIFDDEKILLIESLPDSYAIITVWFKLLCLAGKMNNSGVFMMNEKIAYTDKMLATIFRMKESTVQLALQTFEQFGMVEIIDGVITIPNWGKHQSLDQLENKKKYMKKYMKEYREKQVQITCKTNCKTNSKTNVRQADIDIEEDIDKDINNISIADKSAKEPKAEIIKQYFDDNELNSAFNNWIKYKKEKRQAYKETGLKSLITQINNNVDKYGVTKVIDVIEKSMSANYQGIVWDWITKSESRGCLSTEERVERMKNEFTNNFKFKNSVPERFIG